MVLLVITNTGVTNGSASSISGSGLTTITSAGGGMEFRWY
jgi:hypothetical protein